MEALKFATAGEHDLGFESALFFFYVFGGVKTDRSNFMVIFMVPRDVMTTGSKFVT